MSEPQTHTSTRITVDYSVPLWGVLSVIGAGFMLLVGMYFNAAQTQKSVEELQILVKSGNNSVNLLDREVNLLKFRVDGHDASIRNLETKK